MKRIVLLCIFTIGLLSVNHTSYGVAKPPGEVCFVVDHAGVFQATIVADVNYIMQIEKSENKVYSHIYQKGGGGVVVQIFSLVTQPTYLNRIRFDNYGQRISNSFKDIGNHKLKCNKVFVCRKARDGLTKV